MTPALEPGTPGEGARIVTMPAEAERTFTAHVGMTIFLGSWAMMFGALFFAYAMLRVRSPVWPPVGVHLPLLVPALNTAVIVLSGLALRRGSQAVDAGRGSLLLPWLAVAAGLGAAFLAIQCASWWGLWSAGLTSSSSPFGSTFYLLTVFHALHVLVGLGLLGTLFPGAARHAYDVRRRTRLRLVSMFWHFVAVVWILMFVSVYLV